MIIRKATVDDAENIARIQVKTWQCAYRNQMPDSFLVNMSVKDKAEKWAERIQKPDKGVDVYVGEEEGEIIGWCSVGPNRDDDLPPKTGEIYSIYLDTKYMGKGFGTQLMNYGLQDLANKGYVKVSLWVLETNQIARNFYGKKGFTADGKTKIDKRDGFDLHEIRYIKV